MSDTPPKMTTVCVTHTFKETPEQVFDAWLDPAIAGRFLFATPSGQMIKAEIDARVGGHFNFTDRRADMGDIEHVGTYLEIDRPKRLVFDFAVPKFSNQASRVSLEFFAAGSGCRVLLTHQGVLEEYAKQTEGGWGMILEGLMKALA